MLWVVEAQLRERGAARGGQACFVDAAVQRTRKCGGRRGDRRGDECLGGLVVVVWVVLVVVVIA